MINFASSCSSLGHLRPTGLVLCLLLVSTFSILAFGINGGSHQFYNLSYIHVFSYPDNFSDTPLEIILASDFNRFLLLTLAPTLSNPSFVIPLTLLANILLLFIVFHVLRTIFSRLEALVLVVILGVVANSPIYGFVANELIFTRKTLVPIFTLTSILFYLKGRPLAGGICASIGILFHPLNAISLLFFFYPSLIVYQLYTHAKSDFRRLILSLLPVILTLIYTVISGRDGSDSPNSIKFHEWYLLSLILEADDVAMFWKLLDGAIIFLPTLILAFSFSLAHLLKHRQEHTRTTQLHILNIVQLPLLVAIVLFEGLLIAGFEIPRISEWFATIQLRRGIWLPTALGLITIYSSLVSQPQTIQKRWILGVSLAAVLDHTLFPIVIFVATIAFTTNERAIRVGSIIALGLCVAFGLLGTHDLSSVHILKHTALFVFIVGIFVAIARVRGLVTAFIFGIVIHSLVIATNSLVLNQSFINSLKIVRGELSLNQNAVAEQRVITAVNDLPIQKPAMVLFAPISLGYNAQLLSSTPLFLSRWDNMQIFSPEDFVKLRDKLSTLSMNTRSCGSTFGSKTGCFLQKAQEAIDSLSLEQIAAIKLQYPIKVVIRRTPLIGLEPSTVVEKYFIYMLP